MHAILLCPGPSLAKWLTCLPDHDLSLAVNRAGLALAADWWVSLDYPLVRDIRKQLLGAPRICTTEIVATSFPAEKKDWLLTDRVRRDYCRNLHSWTFLTAPAALIVAGFLGATSITVVGADWTDEPDWDGVRLQSNDRTADRWAKEAVRWQAACDWLAKRGVTVERRKHGVG